jgi:hypothetical protein
VCVAIRALPGPRHHPSATATLRQSREIDGPAHGEIDAGMQRSQALQPAAQVGRRIDNAKRYVVYCVE